MSFDVILLAPFLNVLLVKILANVISIKRVYLRNATNIELLAKFEYTVIYFNKEPDIW